MADSASFGYVGPGGLWAPRTKFVRPAVSTNVVIAEPLVEGVRASLAATAVTLISAQAGAGKTTLASAAVGPGSPMPSAWITVDSGDDDLASILGLLGTAITMVVPDGCPAFLALLHAGVGSATDPRRAVGALINDLLRADPAPFVLVIDDLHALSDRAVFAALDYLMAHAPPALRLLLTSRVDPPLALSRLRASGRLTDVRGDDLRLDVDQANTILNERLGLGVGRDEVAAIVVAVGGWATGVRLLGRSHHRGDVLGVARPTDGNLGALYEYLTDEIFTDERPDLRQFLFDTCVLAELTPRACAVMAERQDAGAVLDDLHRRLHYLVLAVDIENHLYRYHDLFADFLRRRLAAHDPSRLAELHRRAASVIDEAPRRIEHLLAAGDVRLAAEAIEAVGRALMHQPTALERVAAWIDRLPDDVVASRKWLSLLAGTAATNRGDMTTAVERLGPLVEPLRADDDFLGEWVALRNLHQATNDHRGLVPRIAQLATRLEFSALRPALQVDHHIGAAYGALYTERWDEAAFHVATAIGLAMRTDDPVSAEILALHISPFFAVVDGGLDRIEAYVEHVDARFPAGPSFVRVGVLHQRALTALLRGRFDDAADAAMSGAALLDRLGGGLAYLQGTFDWVLTTAWIVNGDLAQAALRLSQRRRERPAADLDRTMIKLQIPLYARVLRGQGRSDQLHDLARELNDGPRLVPTAEIDELIKRSTTAQLAWHVGDLDVAVADLRAGAELEDRLRFVPFVGSPRVDLAVLLAEMGKSSESREQFALALRTNEERGTPGLIAQAGRSIIPLLRDARERGLAPKTVTAALAALGGRAAPTPIAVPGSPDVLSSREVEVLRLLVAGASNRDIAESLVLSEHTAKTHVRHIMSKLAVRSRSQAAARARDEHLI